MDTNQEVELLYFRRSTVIITALLVYVVYQVYSWIASYRRLSHIPGPRLAAWSNLWWVRAAVSRKGHLYLDEVLRQYGELAS